MSKGPSSYVVSTCALFAGPSIERGFMMLRVEFIGARFFRS